MPDAIPDDTAAQLYINPLTAWAMLVERHQVRPGDHVVLNAAGSSFGRIVLQLSALLGFRAIALVRRPGLDADLRALGAAAVIDTSSAPVEDAVAEATRGQGARLALDAVGGGEGLRLARMVAPGGCLVPYGLLSGGPVPDDVRTVIDPKATVRPFWLRTWLEKAGEPLWEEGFRTVLSWVLGPRVRLAVDRRVSLDRVAEAVRADARPGRVGKVLLVPRAL